MKSSKSFWLFQSYKHAKAFQKFKYAWLQLVNTVTHEDVCAFKNFKFLQAFKKKRKGINNWLNFNFFKVLSLQMFQSLESLNFYKVHMQRFNQSRISIIEVHQFRQALNCWRASVIERLQFLKGRILRWANEWTDQFFGNAANFEKLPNTIRFKSCRASNIKKHQTLKGFTDWDASIIERLEVLKGFNWWGTSKLEKLQIMASVFKRLQLLMSFTFWRAWILEGLQHLLVLSQRKTMMVE